MLNIKNMAKSYSTQITDAKVMLDALKANKGKVTKIDDDFLTEMENLKTEAEKLNGEQEKLKADLKIKTDALNAKLKALDEKYTFAKKRIKVDVPQGSWKEYGIDASK